MNRPPIDLTAAEQAAEEAAAELDRQQLIAHLCSKPGLVYASLGAHNTGPYLVANQGEIVGEVHTETGAPLLNWYATRYGADGEAVRSGPFVTIRAAAASMI